MGYRASHEVYHGRNETVPPEQQNSLVYRLEKRFTALWNLHNM